MSTIKKIAKREIARIDSVNDIIKLVTGASHDVVANKDRDIKHLIYETGNIQIGIVSKHYCDSHISISILIDNMVSVALMSLIIYKDTYKSSEFNCAIYVNGYLEDEINEMYLHLNGFDKTCSAIVDLGFTEIKKSTTFGELFLSK